VCQQTLRLFVELIIGVRRITLKGQLKRSFSLNHSSASSRSPAIVVATTPCWSISYRLSVG